MELRRAQSEPAGSPAATRARIMDAAAHVVVQRGMTALTLDSVAASAGVSKGGLLHHFRSKNALLRALVEDRAASLAAAVEREFNSARLEEAGSGRAYLRAVMRLTDSERSHPTLRVLAAVAAAEPALAACVTAARAAFTPAARDAAGDFATMQPYLVADGLWLAQLLSDTGASPALRAAIRTLVRVDRSEPL